MLKLFLFYINICPCLALSAIVESNDALTAHDIQTYANIKKVYACVHEILKEFKSKKQFEELNLNRLAPILYDKEDKVTLECLTQDTILLYYRATEYAVYLDIRSRFGIFSLVEHKYDDYNPDGKYIYAPIIGSLSHNKAIAINELGGHYIGKFYEILRINDNIFPPHSDEQKTFDQAHKIIMTKKWELLEKLEASERTAN